MDLGPESAFTKFPAAVNLGDESYYLVKGKKGYLLLSAVCPHHGGGVIDWGSVFMCPDHGWRFEHSEGVCINGPNARMFSFPVNVQEGHLIVQLPSS